MAVAGHLEQPTRGFLRRLAVPEDGRCGSHLAAYLALLRLGVAVPLLLPEARWALTPPFHPYHPVARGRFVFCGPVRRLAAPRRYLAVYPMELGLSSSALRHPRPPRSTSPGRYLSLTQARQPTLGLAHEPLQRRIRRFPLVQHLPELGPRLRGMSQLGMEFRAHQPHPADQPPAGVEAPAGIDVRLEAVEQ